MPFKQTAISAAKKAGSLMQRYFGKKIPGVKSKGTSLVTSIDLRCNDIIVGAIKKDFAAHNIITEEASPINNKSEYTWFIDPIDGTHNFIRGLPMCGVSIGLAKNDEAILGVVYLPFFNKLYVAQKGKGAFCNGKRIRVSKANSLDFSFLILENSMSARKTRLEVLKKLTTVLTNDRLFGCAIYSAALIADGTVDGYILFSTNSWDIVASFLIIEEAGGMVTNHKGERWTPYQRSYVVSNPRLHKKLLSLLQ